MKSLMVFFGLTLLMSCAHPVLADDPAANSPAPELLVYIDKDTQSFEAFLAGQKVMGGPVSTGREQFESRRQKLNWLGTPAGEFQVLAVDRVVTDSDLDLKMNFAIQLSESLYIYQSPPNAEGVLGTRATEGGVCLSARQAQDLYNLILEVGTDETGYKTRVIIEED